MFSAICSDGVSGTGEASVVVVALFEGRVSVLSEGNRTDLFVIEMGKVGDAWCDVDVEDDVDEGDDVATG